MSINETCESRPVLGQFSDYPVYSLEMDETNFGTSSAPPPCGCKGIRTCALCQNTERASKVKKCKFDFSVYETFVYVSSTTKTAKKIAVTDADAPIAMADLFEIQKSFADSGDAESLVCDNIILIPEFLSEKEEADLVNKIDAQPWMLSQSGRRKQDYGPRVNFKQRKLKIDAYSGMPAYSAFLLDRMAEMAPDSALSDYVPFELCNLEYNPERRSCIDFHIDDTWIWGERLISINLLAGSVMTLVHDHRRLLYVPMPRRSLLCMAGPMRYQWSHGVLPEHIRERRVALTMREPSKTFQRNGELFEKWGRTLAERAKQLIEL